MYRDVTPAMIQAWTGSADPTPYTPNAGGPTAPFWVWQAYKWAQTNSSVVDPQCTRFLDPNAPSPLSSGPCFWVHPSSGIINYVNTNYQPVVSWMERNATGNSIGDMLLYISPVIAAFAVGTLAGSAAAAGSGAAASGGAAAAGGGAAAAGGGAAAAGGGALGELGQAAAYAGSAGAGVMKIFGDAAGSVVSSKIAAAIEPKSSTVGAMPGAAPAIVQATPAAAPAGNILTDFFDGLVNFFNTLLKDL